MKRKFAFVVIALMCLILCGVLSACNNQEEEQVVTYTEIAGSDAFDAAYNGAAVLAERSANLLSKSEYTAGIRADLDFGGEKYTLKLNANVNGDAAAKNEIAAELFKDDSLRLGLYVFNRMLYVYDGVKYRFLDMFSKEAAPTTGVDLAGAIGSLGGIVKDYTSGSITEEMEGLQKNNSILKLIKMLLSGYNGTLSSEGDYLLELPLGQIVSGVVPLLDMFQIDLGFELSSLNNLFKTLIGASYDELTAKDSNISADQLARLTVGFSVNESKELDYLNLNYTLGETSVTLALKDIVLAEGRRDILPQSLSEAAAGGIQIKGESWLNGQKIYSDIRLSIDTKSSTGINMIFKAGSKAGADDYIYAIYSGNTLGRIRKFSENGSFTTANPNGIKGAFNARVSPEFMQIVSPLNAQDVGLPKLPGLRFYAFIDLFEAIDSIKTLIGGGMSAGGMPAGETPSPVGAAAASGTDSTIGIISEILNDIGLNDGGIQIAGLTEQRILGLLGALIPTFDSNLNLAAIVGDAVNSISGFLGITTQLPHVTNPNEAGYRPYYIVESLLSNILGKNVMQGLELGDFLDSMALKLNLGVNLQDAFGLKLGIDLSTTNAEYGSEPVTVSAGNSVFTVGFCDEVKPSSADANFTVDMKPSAGEYRYEVSGGIPKIGDDYYEDYYFGWGGETLDTLDTVMGFAMKFFQLLSGFALFG